MTWFMLLLREPFLFGCFCCFCFNSTFCYLIITCSQQSVLPVTFTFMLVIFKVINKNLWLISEVFILLAFMNSRNTFNWDSAESKLHKKQYHLLLIFYLKKVILGQNREFSTYLLYLTQAEMIYNNILYTVRTYG